MKKFGIIGRPLTHSFSQGYFTEKFEKEGILNHIYNKHQLETIEEFPSILSDELVGLNVTLPYKQEVMQFLDHIEEEAKEIGAVNVIKIEKRENKQYLTGYNSDYYGFINSFKPHLKPHHTKALVLGTGGASKAIIHALNELGIDYKYVSRTKTDNNFTYEELTHEVMNEYKIVINCTPLGTFPKVDASPSIPYKFISQEHYCYDLVYNPEVTQFMHKSAQNGAFTKNGYEMLIGQAEKAWEIWNR
jgi:shikimate dehydrogenase